MNLELISYNRLNCYRNQLTNLDVSANTTLNSLSCSSNQLTNLDISTNTALTYLSCYSNQLTNLDVSTNTVLAYSLCNKNKLTSLNISTNTTLRTLWCYNNELTSLDVSKNTVLTTLFCSSNQLMNLNVKNGNNNNFRTFIATNNSSLTCIQVDTPEWSTTNWTRIDLTASFSENCDNSTQSSSAEPTTRAKSKQNTIISDFNQNKKNEFSDIYIYPNPTKDVIYINNIGGNTTYILLNVRGQVLKEGILTIGSK